jgi:hypothetical protein
LGEPARDSAVELVKREPLTAVAIELTLAAIVPVIEWNVVFLDRRRAESGGRRRDKREERRSKPRDTEMRHGTLLVRRAGLGWVWVVVEVPSNLPELPLWSSHRA